MSVVANPERTPGGSPVEVAARAARRWVLPVLIAVVTVALRVPALGHQSFWYDESYTYRLVHLGFGQMFTVLPKTELTPPLYYILVWGWAKLFGTTEAGLRSLSAVAGVVTVPVLYALGRKLVSERVGLAAAALAACNPLLIWYAREARSYALLVLLASLSLLAFAHLLRRGPTWRPIVAWALAAGLAGATHYYATLIIVPEALWLLWVHRRDWRVWVAVIGTGCADLALLPLALTQQPKASWIAGWPLGRRLAQIPPQLLLGTGAPDRDVLKAIGAAALLAAIALLFLRTDATERRAAVLGGALALSGFAIAMGLVAFGVDELIARNLIVVLIGLIVLLAAALGAHRAGRLGAAALLALCAVGVVSALAVMANPAFQRPDWRGVAHVITVADHGAARPRVVIIERYFSAAPLDVYLPGLRKLAADEAVRTREVDLVAALAPLPSWFCWWGAECNLRRSRIDLGLRIRGFRPARPLLHADQFTILRLVARHPVRVTWGELFRAMLPSHEDGWALDVQPAG